MNWQLKAVQLWRLLDDLDTFDDVARADDKMYRELAQALHQRRWSIMTGQEYDHARLTLQMDSPV